MTDDRLAHLREFMGKKKLGGMIIAKPESVHYFSGFRGDSTLLFLSARHNFLVTDFRYTEQATKEAPLFEVFEQREGLWKKTGEVIKKALKRGKIGFEGEYLTFNDYRRLVAVTGDVGEAIPVSLDELRMVKTSEEISLMRRACEIADIAFTDIVKFIKPGMSENEVAARLETVMRQNGSEKAGFATIVASGVRGSLPHGVATEKLIVSGEFVTMDYGAVFKGYHSDLTRTVAVGEITGEQQRIYDTVLEAQLLGLSKAMPGASGKEVDAAVRAFLRKSDKEKYFGHGLGHGVGLEIHEEPRLSQKSKLKELLPGMIVTVEPGVYIEDFCGVRIEDTVLVTEAGCEPLTHSDKNLIKIL